MQFTVHFVSYLDSRHHIFKSCYNAVYRALRLIIIDLDASHHLNSIVLQQCSSPCIAIDSNQQIIPSRVTINAVYHALRFIHNYNIQGSRYPNRVYNNRINYEVVTSNVTHAVAYSLLLLFISIPCRIINTIRNWSPRFESFCYLRLCFDRRPVMKAVGELLDLLCQQFPILSHQVVTCEKCFHRAQIHFFKVFCQLGKHGRLRLLVVPQILTPCPTLCCLAPRAVLFEHATKPNSLRVIICLSGMRQCGPKRIPPMLLMTMLNLLNANVVS